MEEPIEVKSYEFTGNFETDYNECCRLQSLAPFHLAKIGLPLPPLPSAKAASEKSDNFAVPRTANLSPKKCVGNASSTYDVSPASKPSTGLATERQTPFGKPGFHKSDLHIDTNSDALLRYTSKYRFSPAINVETNEYDDDIYKIEIRGWKLSVPMSEIVGNAVTFCTSITNLVLWNCNLSEAHTSSLLNVISNSNVRTLSIDQNPMIPETFFASLIGEESNLKILIARGNAIGDVGAKAIGNALKINRNLSQLSLWDNKIQKDGTEMIAEGLKVNQVLSSLSLGKNFLGDEGACALAKALSNTALKADEIQQRRKMIADIEKQRKDQEDDPKKLKKGVRPPPGKAPSKPEENKDAGKMKTPVTAKGNKKELPTPIAKTPKTPDDALKTPLKKGPLTAVPDDKSKAKDKKTPTAPVPPLLKGKKGKEDSVVDVDETANTGFLNQGSETVEPMYEINGQWYILGNRTLSNLDLSLNGITEVGLKALLEAVTVQDTTNDQAAVSDGFVGLYRLSLQVNRFDLNHSTVTAINTLLNARNPFFESIDVDNGDLDHSANPSEVASVIGDEAQS